MANKKIIGSIKGKLIVNIMLLVLVIIVVTGYIQYRINSEQLLQKTRQEVSTLAAVAALLVDGDSHQQLRVKEDQFTKNFEDIRSKLQQVGTQIISQIKYKEYPRYQGERRYYRASICK